MIRNFVAGLLWGVVVVGLVLAGLSLMSPLPAGKAPAARTAAVPAPQTQAPEPQAPQTQAPEPQAPEPQAAAAAAPDQKVPATEPMAPAVPAGEPGAPAEPAAPAVLATAPLAEPAAPGPGIAQPATQAEAPPAPDAPAENGSSPALASGADTAPAAAAPAALPATATAEPAPAPADLPPAQPAEAQESLLTPAPDAAAPLAPALIEPDPVAPAAEPAQEATLPPVLKPGEDATLAPSAGLAPSVDGVADDRLPQIGATPAATDAGTAAAPPVDSRPIAAFARAFTPAGGKPAFALVLRDTGAADLDRASLAALPFPLTFAVDPALPGAAEAAAIYRAAGQEVVMLASGIPAGATAADLEQTFQANAATLPETVAVLDLATGGFQDDRPLASLVVPVIGAQGRGVLTYDRGLNAADQVARREGVPSAVAFRDLDAEGEDAQKIRRYLDRAAFKAAQEGRVVVVGSTRPDTIAALMEWTVEGRAGSVELAPLTAVLSVP